MYDDRAHYPDTDNYQHNLNLHDPRYIPVEDDRAAMNYPHQIEASAFQHFRDAAPVVTSMVPQEYADDVRMTSAKARWLIALLTRLVDTVDPQQPESSGRDSPRRRR
jgi:hypothetical protein